jgi:tyrosyl-tRNA synthetase
MSSSSEVIETLRARGFVQQISDEAGLAALLGGGPITYYAGFDPTRASLQLGNSVPLLAMAHLARAGHRPIAVLGGGTSMIGDPSGKTEMRQLMSAETIADNRRGVEGQVRRYLEAAGDRAIVVDNAEWLLPLKYIDFLREVGRHFSVNRMLAAEGYRQRMERGLSFIEFNYQLLQAYDFLILRRRYGCVLQIGGDDQWGNILAGTDLIRRMDQADAYALTFPLITTAAGTKMGKTAAGAVWLSAEMTSPFEFYQYFVNVDDRDVERFLKLFTFLPLDEIARYAALGGAELRVAKSALAFHATAIVHGEEAARAAQDAARAAFSGGGASELVPTHQLTAAQLDAGLRVVDVLAGAGLAASKSAARRLIEQGGVKLGERKISSVDDVVTRDDVGQLLHAGKKHVRRLVLQG